MNRLFSIIISFILIFPPLAFGAVHQWAITVLDLSILLLIFIWAVNSIRQGAFTYRPNVLNIFFLAFAFYAAFQVFFSITKLPHATAMTITTAFIYFGLFFAVTNLISTKEEIEKLLFRVTLIGFFVSLVGLAQLVAQTDKIYWLRHVSHNCFFGTFMNENNFACYAAMAALITLGSIVSGLYGGVKISSGATTRQILFIISDKILNEKTLFKIFAFAVIASAIFLSRSRGSMMFFMASALFFILFIFLRNRARPAGWAVFFGILCTYLILDWFGMTKVLTQLGSLFSKGAYEGRVVLYTAGLDLFKDYPAFGVGFGAFADIYRMYKFGTDILFPRYMHNEPLQLLVEAGAAGFLIIASLLFAGLVKPVSRFFNTSSTYKYCTGMGIFSALLYLGMHSFTDFGLRINPISSLAVIMLALFLVMANLEPSGRSMTVNMRKRTFPLPQGPARTYLLFITAAAFVYACFFVTKPLAAQIISEHGGSARSFKVAMNLDPGNSELYYKYFMFNLKRNMVKDASLAIDEAIRLNPYKAIYVIAKGRLEFQEGSYDKAFDLFRRAILMEPCHSRPYLIYAYALFKRALNIPDAERRKYLLNKGAAYYKIARNLSMHVDMRMVIGDKAAYESIKEALAKEGIEIR